MDVVVIMIKKYGNDDNSNNDDDDSNDNKDNGNNDNNGNDKDSNDNINVSEIMTTAVEKAIIMIMKIATVLCADICNDTSRRR